MKKLIFALALAGVASPVLAGELVGQWCDRSVEDMALMDSVIRIEIRESGPVLVDLFQGSAREAALSTEGEGVFVETDSADGYRIVGEDLELFDEMGIIRTAWRMDDDAPAEECWR